jgi:DNA-binding MarR family transcriptional regulator
MLDRLENGGLIERKPNPNDRRGTLITLAKAGADRVGPWFTSARQAQNELVASYSESELQFLLDFFEKNTAMWEKERMKLQEDLQGGR